jgi:hypothetical protein
MYAALAEREPSQVRWIYGLAYTAFLMGEDEEARTRAEDALRSDALPADQAARFLDLLTDLARQQRRWDDLAAHLAARIALEDESPAALLAEQAVLADVEIREAVAQQMEDPLGTEPLSVLVDRYPDKPHLKRFAISQFEPPKASYDLGMDRETQVRVSRFLAQLAAQPEMCAVHRDALTRLLRWSGLTDAPLASELSSVLANACEDEQLTLLAHRLRSRLAWRAVRKP